MKAKIYLTHNCDAHKKELGYKEDDPCCDKEEDVGDFEMELVDNSQNRIEFNVPPSGMEGVQATLTLWSGQYKEFITEVVE